MKQYKGAVFFDVDGTLVDERLKIYHPTPKTAEAIGRLRENGYLAGIATGRARCYIPETGIDFDCYVSCNGAVAEVGEEEIFNDYIALPKLREMVDFMEQEGIGYELESSDQCFFQKESKAEFDALLAHFHITADCFFPLESLDQLKTNKILITFQRMEQFEKMCEKFGSEYAIIQHHRNLSADIGKRHISKASGIRAVIDRLNLDIADTYAFGDDGNDFEMLAAVGHGVAMTPHAARLDEVADSITCGVAEDGVYHGLKKLGLI